MSDASNSANDRNGQEYDDLLLLDDLESLLEEFGESEALGEDPPEQMDHLHAFGLSNLADLQVRIRELHERLDTTDSSEMNR